MKTSSHFQNVIRCLALLSLVLFLTRGSAAQTEEGESTLHCYASLGGGIPKLGTAGITFISNKNVGGSFFLRGVGLPCNGMPSDYKGLFKATDDLTSLSGQVEWAVPVAPKVRFGFGAGPSMVILKESYNFRKNQSGSIFSYLISNYTFSTRTTNGFGLSARLKFEFPLSRYCGFEIALVGNINTARSMGGLEVCLTLGKLRGRLKK